uniref:Epd_3 protein n=1 Tax=Fopius arisanus TaxID=64838 RepID=A0A0C9RWP8_9HYME
MENIAYFFILGIFCIINTPVSGQLIGDGKSICVERGGDPSKIYECIEKIPEILYPDGSVNLDLLKQIYAAGESSEDLPNFLDHIQIHVENKKFSSVRELVQALVVAWTEYPKLPWRSSSENNNKFL